MEYFCKKKSTKQLFEVNVPIFDAFSMKGRGRKIKKPSDCFFLEKNIDNCSSDYKSKCQVLLTWGRRKISEPRKLEIFLDTRKNISVKNNISPEKKGKVATVVPTVHIVTAWGGALYCCTALHCTPPDSDLYSIPPGQLAGAVEAGDCYAEVVSSRLFSSRVSVMTAQ